MASSQRPTCRKVRVQLKWPELAGQRFTTGRLERGTSHVEYPHVALRGPHTAKIHTLITLGIGNRTKPPVFKARKAPPRGFDSHRPLHPQATPGHVGLPDWRQHIDPMGKSWEFDAHRAAVESPHVSLHCPKNHTYSHTQQVAGGRSR
jgi:hypothetical protein